MSEEIHGLLVLMACVFAIGIPFVIADSLKKAGEKRKASEAADAAEAARKDAERWNKARVDMALTCLLCRGLAEPIRETRNRYRCGSCGHQFAGEPHGW